jgi:hypothetical protein
MNFMQRCRINARERLIDKRKRNIAAFFSIRGKWGTMSPRDMEQVSRSLCLLETKPKVTSPNHFVESKSSKVQGERTLWL